MQGVRDYRSAKQTTETTGRLMSYQARTEGGFGRFGRTALLKKGPQFTL